MNRRWPFVAVFVLVSAGALAVRLLHIEDRPMHGDEAVHALKFQILWETGRYEYDLNEFHGPTIYYLALPVVWLAGVTDFSQASEWMFRLVPALFSVGTLLLLLLFRDAIGTWAVICAGVLTAVSPAMVFYSSYYIQESVLVFFTFGAIVCGWRYVVSRRLAWAIAGGLSVGLMHATKETCIIAYGCMIGAAIVAWSMRTYHRLGKTVGSASVVEGRAAAQAEACGSGAIFCRRGVLAAGAALIVAIGASMVMFSGFFTHPAGIVDSIRAYTVYFDRAGAGGIHEHPWDYYLRMLLYTRLAPGPVWSEALIVALALVGIVIAARSNALASGSFDKTGGTGWQPVEAPGSKPVPRRVSAEFSRFLAAYAVLMIFAYSVIPYKTPWCMLSLLHAMIVMAGVGAVAVVRAARMVPLQIGVIAALGLGTVHLYLQADRSITTFNCDRRNPYVYAHPVRDVVRLADTIERVAEVHPEGHDMIVYVITPDYWPLPWYLRRFNHVGYWETIPEDCDAPVIITSTRWQAELPRRLNDDYFTAFYGLRPDVVLSVLMSRSLWDQRLEQIEKNILHSSPQTK
jgi:uncharacterized protein (TIGR03663 family)